MSFPSLSQKEYVILDLLRSGSEMFGLEMVKASDGALKRGTIYVTLQRMAEKGYVKSRQEKNPTDPGMPKRVYKISGEGSAVLRATDMALNQMGDLGHA
ncbi:PadR family transcriptional regulator [Tateyamaria sp. SN3-11]|uniref:PadR family transcriptional regulator n=1 Tax=Tateyamaria sp. SN3-11 TaxID=3092147 RepID=UPI0039EAC238